MRALVQSGGGRFGARSVGVVKALYKAGRRYDYFSGNSVGGINSAGLAMFSKEDAMDGIQWLEDFWLRISTKSVWKRWFPLGMVHGAWETGLRNTEPLAVLLNASIDAAHIQEAGNRVEVAAVSLTTGEYRLFDNTHPEFPKAVLASSAFPVLFQAVGMGGDLYSDGGVLNPTPISAAIKAGATDIDIVLTEAERVPEIDIPKHTADVGIRVIGLMSHELFNTHVELTMAINELVTCGRRFGKRDVKLNIYRPDVPLKGDPLEFDVEFTRQLIEEGYNDTSRALKREGK